MADSLAEPRQLAELVGEHLPEQVAVTLLRAATAAVQAAVGRRLVAVSGDEIVLAGSTGSWLDLPEGPVSVVTSVTVDGDEVTEGTTSGTFRRFGARLWRDCGWAESAYTPSVVTVVYSHGYPAGDSALEFARTAALSIAKRAYVRQAAGGGESDEAAARAAVAADLVASPVLRAALRRKYGRRAGAVSVS